MNCPPTSLPKYFEFTINLSIILNFDLTVTTFPCTLVVKFLVLMGRHAAHMHHSMFTLFSEDLIPNLGFPGGSEGKAPACNAGDLGSIPGSGRSPEKEMETHSSTLAWKIPWTEKPGRLQSMGSQRVRHDRVTSSPLLPRGNKRSSSFPHTYIFPLFRNALMHGDTLSICQA